MADAFYLLSDHLGSTTVTVDKNGTRTAELFYKAWGEIDPSRTVGTTPTLRRYTGQYQADTGLMFYQARFFDPYLNRWTQPDPIIQDPNNPQDYDRYAYVRNNPIKYNDPTGYDVGCGGRDGSDCTSIGKYNPVLIRKQLLEKHHQLVAQVRNGQINDREGLATLAKYAASFTPYTPT
jgi:RHS repeat-associated protein